MILGQKICLFFRPGNAPATKAANGLAKWLKSKKHEVFVVDSKNKMSGLSLKPMASADFVVVLGGDGTYLRAVQKLEGRNIPVLGINLGSLGFLTPTRELDMYKAVGQVLAGKYEIKSRSMIESQFSREVKKRHLALNDIVIERGNWSQLINIEISADNTVVNEVKADGIIIATPTGSTAYNLAAGGPILHPDVESIVVSSIAPHSLTNRPMIFPEAINLKFKLVGSRQTAHFIVDGQIKGTLKAGDEIHITRSEKRHLMFCKPGLNYFGLLREKLKFGVRA